MHLVYEELWISGLYQRVTPIGACAFNEYGFSRPLIDTKGLEIPSWEADVGTLTKGIRRLLEIIFAMSTDLPPPMPIKKSG